MKKTIIALSLLTLVACSKNELCNLKCDTGKVTAVRYDSQLVIEKIKPNTDYEVLQSSTNGTITLGKGKHLVRVIEHVAGGYFTYYEDTLNLKECDNVFLQL
jgi:Tfp pilus assembly protein PilP